MVIKDLNLINDCLHGYEFSTTKPLSSVEPRDTIELKGITPDQLFRFDLKVVYLGKSLGVSSYEHTYRRVYGSLILHRI